MPEFVAVRGVTLHAEYRPRPGAPTVVFSNSLGTDLRLWDAVLDRLGDRVATLRWDKQGHGLSGLAAPRLAMADHAADLVALMEHFGVGRAVLAGDSIGGAIAQLVAATRPERVAGLVLLGTATRFGAADMWNARIAAVRVGGVASIADAVMERWFSPGFRAARPTDLAGWRTMLARCDADGYVASCHALAETDLATSTALLRLPAMVAGGTADGSTPPDVVRALADLIPGAGYRSLDGVGHLPPIECPDDVAALILDFIEENALV